MQNARTRRPSSPSVRPAVAMGEMLESRRLLAGHGPMWGGEVARTDSDAGEYMPLHQSRAAMAEWGMGRMNFLIVLAQASDVDTSAASSGISTSSLNASAGNAGASTLSQTASSTSANSSSTSANSNSIGSTRFDAVLANAIAARAATEAVQRIDISNAVPTTPATQGTGSSKAGSNVAVDVKDIMVPVKIVTATPTAAAAVSTAPTLAYETVRRPLFSQEQIPAQSRRAIEATETPSDDQPATIIADAKADEAVATASIAPISIDPLSQPLWQRVAAMAAAGLLVVANTVVRRRARRLAMMGGRR